MRNAIENKTLLTAVLCAITWAPSLCSAEDTVFFVVRHAEKASMDSDPPLSTAGAKRAEQLRQTLENLNVNAIYHTDDIRTKATAQPLAAKMHITPEKYDDPTHTWVADVIAKQKGKRTLIVGHSDTVSTIVGRLTGKTIPEIGDHFDNLFIVVISDDGKSVVRLKYGESN
jgi:broad specificity phosphatase PhoE